MRVGEIKNIIKRVIDENYTIQISNEPLYGGQAYQINNYLELVEALEILSEQKWNTADFSPISQALLNYDRAGKVVVIPTAEFEQLTTYINAINPQLPLYYLTLDSLTEEQDEKTINIKLPQNISSFEDLNNLNKKLEDTLKLFNVDGQFEFKGFDKGTDWYVVATAGVVTYHVILACLKVTQEYFKARKTYFESEEARISYEASLDKDAGGKSHEAFDTYKERWLKIFIETEIKKAIEAIELNGHTREELQTKLVKATTKLVEQLGEGTEFHLSLNPPPYAAEEGGELKIDYKKIKESSPKDEITEPNGLEAPKETEDKTSSDS